MVQPCYYSKQYQFTVTLLLLIVLETYLVMLCYILCYVTPHKKDIVNKLTINSNVCMNAGLSTQVCSVNIDIL